MRSRRAVYDLEEITPGHFIVHNENAYSVLRGEGERRGTLFILTTWRREGLLARIAARNYKTLTLEGRLEALPPLPIAQMPGASGLRPLGNLNERYSVFDGYTRSWQPLEATRDGATATVELREGQIVRRRKGRAAPEYARAVVERSGQIGIQTIGETAAILAGFAQSAMQNAALIPAKRDGDDLVLPLLPLPTPYREFLHRVADETPEGWRVNQRGLPFVISTFERLGMEIATGGE